MKGCALKKMLKSPSMFTKKSMSSYSYSKRENHISPVLVDLQLLKDENVLCLGNKKTTFLKGFSAIKEYHETLIRAFEN